MQKSKIKYFDYFWNVYIGCKENCNYCIAKNIIKNKEVKFFEKELKVDFGKNKKRIFVNPYSEIKYWNNSEFKKIIKYIKKNHIHDFYIFTKYPSLINFEIPDNLKIVITITCNVDLNKLEKIKYKHYLSCAPILSKISLPKKLNIEKIFLCKKNRKNESFININNNYNCIII